MATKTSSITVKQQYSYVVYNETGCTKEVPGVSSPVYLTATSSFTGVSNPRWRQQIALGQNASTDANWSKERLRLSSGSAYCKRGSSFCPSDPVSWTEVSGAFIGIPNHLAVTINTATALNQAKRIANSQIRSTLNPVLGGEILGSIGKTLRMIKSPASTMQKSMKDYLSKANKLRKNRSMTKVERRQAIADTYLEYTYGWNPLIQDSKNGYNALVSHLRVRPFELKRISGTGSVAGTAFQAGSASVGHVVAKYNVMTQLKQSYRVFGAIRVNSGSVPSQIQVEFGFDLSSFAPTLWELLPYSFLIDYFSNVGQIIDAVSLCNANVAWLGLNSRSEQETNVDSIYVTKPWSDVVTTSNSLTAPYRYRVIGSRTGLSNLIPSLEFRLPGFGTKTSLNIAFLLLSRQRDSYWSDSR